MNDRTQTETIENARRDNYADFLKYLLIWMVVLGHFINIYQYSTGLGGLYVWIYTFHMPLFVFISGYFSKHLNNCRRKNIDTLFWPFVVFQILNIVYTAIIPIELLKDNIFYPYHQNWYLIALFWWRSFIPYCQFFKKSVVIVLAFLLCLSVGFTPEWSGFLGLYKTAYFLPFFVLGVFCDDLMILVGKLMDHKFLWVVSFAMITLAVFALCLNADVLYKMNYAFKANSGYNGDCRNLLLRAFALAISIVMCLSVLVVTKVIFNKLSTNQSTVSGGGLCFVS